MWLPYTIGEKGSKRGQWREHHSGVERQEGAEQKAERILQAGLAQAGWRDEDLSQGRKNDPLKLRWLAQLPRETPPFAPRHAGKAQTGG